MTTLFMIGTFVASIGGGQVERRRSTAPPVGFLKDSQRPPAEAYEHPE
jgi:hypothetical protein